MPSGLIDSLFLSAYVTSKSCSAADGTVVNVVWGIDCTPLGGLNGIAESSSRSDVVAVEALIGAMRKATVEMYLSVLFESCADVIVYPVTVANDDAMVSV